MGVYNGDPFASWLNITKGVDGMVIAEIRRYAVCLPQMVSDKMESRFELLKDPSSFFRSFMHEYLHRLI
ncbi:hypothetical protein BOTBODRAFT_614060 [Botryobasidium botryosum FD-172 SS1]|uniref:Uncharacterized protein n=1 Tax=Botryobasidium botryosum (strain FD-172 SS1) TaxID=930990 RepID=A0A067LXX5_BOTB1|nr:hypothetical protein BOTBODRAFT_614060 [Botryobasidium botryosum FD-172 SS1]